MSTARRLGLAIGSALLLALALPNELAPWGTPLGAVACIAPFLAAAVLAPTFRSAALSGAVFGAVSTALSSFWLLFFQEFAIWTLGGVVLAYTGFCALLAAVLRGVALAGGARYRPFLLAATWTVYEYLKSTGFLGYPWGLVAYPIHGLLPLLQIADFAGVWGVSLLVAAVNALVAEGAIRASGPAARGPVARRPAASDLREWGRQAAMVGVLLAASLVYGVVRLAERAPAERSVNLVLVQQNANPWIPSDEAGVIASERLSTEAVAEARLQGIAPELVAWSESSLPWDPRAYRGSYQRYPKERPFLPYLRASGIPHLVGTALDVDPSRNEWMNGAALLRPDGSEVDRYGKQHPVPFAEAIPFWESPLVQRFFTNVVGIQAPWVMGTRSVVFSLQRPAGDVVRFGVPICFEDAFSDLCRQFVLGGADLLVNITNDSWSRTVSALTQHFVAARFRAIENRRVLARATNGGITAVVDEKGKIARILPHFEPGYILATVALPSGNPLTAYTRLGDWLPLCLAAIVLAAVAAGAGRTLRSGRAARRTPTP